MHLKGTAMFEDLKNKVVMVTGAAGGLGQGLVPYFQRLEVQLALVDQNYSNFERAYGDQLPPNSLVVTGNLSNKEEVATIVAQVMERFGRIDVLLNVAGGYRAGKNVVDTSEQDWDFLMNLNAKTAFLVSSAVVPHMIAQGSGRIVNFGAKPALKGTKNNAAYGASKAAVLRLTESMAAEYKAQGINVNAVIPSTLDTPANRSAMPNADSSQWVSPESMAQVLAFLSSDASRDVSGALIPVYGGSV